MGNKNIVFTKLNTAEVVERPLPKVRAGEVLVKLVRSCVSSGTERANLTGVPDNATSVYRDSPDDVITWPRQGGYSSAGVVEAVGKGVKSVKRGDRVALSWSVHAQYVCLPERLVYRMPDNVGFEQAALTHISTFPLAAIRKCRLEVGESALVMGQGVLGQMAVVLLRAAGAMPVIAVDPVAVRRRRALKLGADYAFDPLSPDFVEKVRAVTRTGRFVQNGRVEDCGAKVVVEVTGCGAALNTALDAIAPFGRLALLGCTRDSNFTVNYYRKVHGRGVTLVGAHTDARPDDESAAGWWTTRDDAQAFLRLLAGGRLALKGFVEETHRPEDCGEVYARLAKGGAFPTVQFAWD